MKYFLSSEALCLYCYCIWQPCYWQILNYYITTHGSKDTDHKEIDDEGDKESNAWERKRQWVSVKISRACTTVMSHWRTRLSVWRLSHSFGEVLSPKLWDKIWKIWARFSIQHSGKRTHLDFPMHTPDIHLNYRHTICKVYKQQGLVDRWQPG